MSYCLHCGKPWATHGTACDMPLIRTVLPAVQPDCDPPVAPHCSQCAALRAQLDTALAALEAARPALKPAAVDGSTDADAVLALVQQALSGTSDVPGAPLDPPTA